MRKCWGICLVVLVVIGAGLFSAWATSSASSIVNIPAPTVAGMKITKLTDVNIDSGECGALVARLVPISELEAEEE